MHKLRGLFRQSEFSLLLFFFCLAVFGWPFFAGVKSPVWIFIYLFVAWAVVIMLLFLMSRNYGDKESDSGRQGPADV